MGPGEVTRTSSPTSSISGDRTISATSASAMLIARFAHSTRDRGTYTTAGGRTGARRIRVTWAVDGLPMYVSAVGEAKVASASMRFCVGVSVDTA